MVICNYVLDSLLTDGYKIVNENETRYYARSRIAIYSNRHESDITNPDIIPRYKLTTCRKDLDNNSGDRRGLSMT